MKKNYSQTEAGKRYFIKMYERALAANDIRIIKFCKSVFDVYDKYGINGHIKRPILLEGRQKGNCFYFQYMYFLTEGLFQIFIVFKNSIPAPPSADKGSIGVRAKPDIFVNTILFFFKSSLRQHVR
jgi:hypothetical protein